MNGLLLAERYYHYFGLPMIEKKFPDYVNRIAAGLVGLGSDCFGYDDMSSQDHDWGPGFCLWLCGRDYEDIGKDLQNEYYKLPKTFAGIKPRVETKFGVGRIGVLDIKQFYKSFTMLDDVPATWEEWIRIPEVNLAAATNGKIFSDPFGEFTYYRNKLLGYYPEDVRLRKIAERCITIGREGQYNIARSAKRNEIVAARLAESRFVEAAISLTFLLNYRYAPFYKWMHRALKTLPVLGNVMFELIDKLIKIPYEFSKKNFVDEKIECVNTICGYIAQELVRQQICKRRSDFLIDYVNEIFEKIEIEEVRHYQLYGNI